MRHLRVKNPGGIVIKAILFVVGLFVAYKGYKRYFTDEGKQDGEHGKAVKDLEEDAEKIGAQISESDAVLVANRVHQMLSGVTEDETGVIELLSQYENDPGGLLLIVAKFGRREAGISWLGGQHLDMFGWFRKYMSDENISDLNDIFSKTGKTI